MRCYVRYSVRTLRDKLLMTYSAIDGVLEEWCRRHAVTLSIEEGYPRRRYFYKSAPPNETFQVVVEPEFDGLVRVDAHLIESTTDEKFQLTFCFQGRRLPLALDMLWDQMKKWFDDVDRE